ncbi:30S ribosomal protein S8 [Candidatus Woesearchaeota archaeon]|nr:30S ribosomal protein S8 [Candidatus Woesearchaeota archaeon]
MLNDPLATALSKILNAERRSKKEVLIKPASKIIKTVLTIMNENQFIGGFEEIEDGKGGFIKVQLIGNLNKCGVIKPRFSTKKNEFEKWEKRYLPAKDLGLIIVSTPRGIITHLQAKEKNTGGKLLVYCY